jgi:hypothetical protein
MNSTTFRILRLKQRSPTSVAAAVALSVASAKLKAYNARTANKTVVKKPCCGSCASGRRCESEKDGHHH